MAGEPKEKPELLVPRSSLVRVVPGHWMATAAINVSRISLLSVSLSIFLKKSVIVFFNFFKKSYGTVGNFSMCYED